METETPLPQDSREGLAEALGRLRSDAAFRLQVEADPVGHLRQLGLVVPEGVTLTVVADTADTMHFVVPPPFPEELQDEQLGSVTAGSGGCVSSAATALTFSSVATSSSPSTMSTASSSGSISSAG